MMNRTMRQTALIVLLLLALVSAAFATRKERLIDTWKPTNYNVSLSFNEALSEITKAQADITIVSLTNSLTHVDLDFGEMPIDSVSVNNQTASYHRSPGIVDVTFARPLKRNQTAIVSITYHGKPKDGLILSKDKANRPSVVGDNWPDRVHHWIPSLDHPSAKATVTFSITAPAHDVVVANGKLIAMTGTATTRTWKYEESAPIPPYCMIVAVGDFANAMLANDVTSVSSFVPQPDAVFAMQGFAPANPSVKFFSETVAPYPYEKLALIIGATRFGGMENSSAIVFPSTLFDRRAQTMSKVFNIREGLVEVEAHEIAHQWFGDSVTESTWADLWLSEGFAQYFAGLFLEHAEGKNAFLQYMNQQATTYFSYEKQKRTPIHDTETENLFDLLNANNYQKGAWVLHMLRAELGDEEFFRGIRTYYQDHISSTVTTEDLRTALEKASHRDLKQFFSSWIYGTGHPHYELSWKWNNATKKAALLLKQTQAEPAFPNSVAIEIANGSETRRVTLKPQTKETTAEVKLTAAPTKILIDPENVLLKDAKILN
jgi:aminopeptidase N